jgi:plastocyanin
MTTKNFWTPLGEILFAALFSVSFLSAQEQSAANGTIRGKISVFRSDDVTTDLMHERALNRYETGSESLKPAEPYRLYEKAVVYLESVPGKYDAPVDHARLDQRDLLFRPLVLPVLVGTTVDFPNDDPLYHNVFSISGPKEFDLGRYPKGQKKSVVFDRTGIVSVFCEIHSYMFSTILVLQNPFFATPDDDGTYAIPNVPTGTYKMNFWYGRKSVETRTITVRNGETTTVNFSY